MANMQRWALGVSMRLGTALLILVVGAVCVFLAMKAAPGDAAITVLGENANPEAVRQFRAAHHLDLPLWQQLGSWAQGLLHGDFGRSLTLAGGTPIGALLWPRLINTAFIGCYALVLGVTFSLVMGTYAARARGRAGDAIASSIMVLGISMPDFWLSYLLILGLALGTGLLPAYGFISPTASLSGALVSGFLPALAIALPMAAVFARTLRAALLEVSDRDYVRTARSFGFSEPFVFWHFALRNALIPYVTVIGLQVRYLLGGVVVIERIFGVAGLGSLLTDAALGRDYPVVQACAVTFLLVVLLVNVVVDMTCMALDPRRAP